MHLLTGTGNQKPIHSLEELDDLIRIYGDSISSIHMNWSEYEAVIEERKDCVNIVLPELDSFYRNIVIVFNMSSPSTVYRKEEKKNTKKPKTSKKTKSSTLKSAKH